MHLAADGVLAIVGAALVFVGGSSFGMSASGGQMRLLVGAHIAVAGFKLLYFLLVCSAEPFAVAG